MSKFGLTAAVLAAGALLWSASANANTITINAAQIPQTPTFPPSFTTLTSGASPVVVPSTLCCGLVSQDWVVQAAATGTSPLPPGQLDTNTIDVALGAGTLIVWFTETDLTSPVGMVNITSGLTTDLLEGAISSVTLATFLSPTNSISPPNGTPIDTFTFTAIGTQTSTVPVATGPGPYSLQAVYTIMATGVGNANLTIDITTAAVPEPATLALLGTGLAGLGLLRRRRRTA